MYTKYFLPTQGATQIYQSNSSTYKLTHRFGPIQREIGWRYKIFPMPINGIDQCGLNNITMNLSVMVSKKTSP
jgi:hypothetical protein